MEIIWNIFVYYSDKYATDLTDILNKTITVASLNESLHFRLMWNLTFLTSGEYLLCKWGTSEETRRLLAQLWRPVINVPISGARQKMQGGSYANY